MPEGPEIRRAADQIAAKLIGQVVETAWFGLPWLEPFAPQLSGRRVVDLETRGKALLIHFEHGLTLYSHNQLYGRWFVRSRESYPKTNRSLRVALHTADASALLYSASEIAVLDERGLGEHPFLRRIGPDLLSRDLTPHLLLARLRSRRFRNRALGRLYLDQSFVAGIGNYLRSEILYFARMHPRKRPSDLTAAQQRKLAAETLAVGRRAYELGGITNTPRRIAQLKKKGLKRRHYRYAVFGRTGKPCYRCRTEVEKLSIASRRLYLCPACQAV